VLPLLYAGTAFAAGSLTVRSEPSGARIFVDGADTGLFTPATVANLPAGLHAVTLQGACSRGEAAVRILDGRTEERLIPLVDGGGTLTVQVTPGDAEVTVDGAAVVAGQPLAVGCGPRTLAASRAGHTPAVLTVQVGYGDELVVPLSLAAAGGAGPAPASLTVVLTPAQAVLSLDGTVLGPGPRTVPSLAPGSHRLAATLDGYRNVQQAVELAPGEAATVSLTLKPGGRGRQVAGWSLVGVGGASTVFGGALLARTAGIYRSLYLDGDFASDAAAEAYHAQVIVPRRNTALVALGAGLAAVGGGVVLVF